MNCPHCAQPLPGAGGSQCPACGRNTYSEAAGGAAGDAARRVLEGASAAGRAVDQVLDDPRLRERLPGGSLPLLGAGLVGAAVLLPVLPFIDGDLGLPWSVVMLAGSVLLGVREWHAAGRALPAPLPRLAGVARHPAFLPLFTSLTGVHAFLSLGLGLAPLAWVLAAVVLGSVQWRALKASPVSAPELVPQPGQPRLRRWVLLGTLACALGLLLPWRTYTSLPTGGIRRETVRDTYIDRDFGREIVEESRWVHDSMLFSGESRTASGRGRAGAPLAVLSLMALAALAALPRLRAGLPSFTLPALAGFLTLWGVTGLAAQLGPWLFLVGVLAIDVAVARVFLAGRAVRAPSEAGPG